MLLLLHALTHCLAAYILPSSPVLLHIYCTCFSTFWHCPYIFQHFMCSPIIKEMSGGVMHVTIVAWPPHPLSCCIYIALIPCLAAYILPSFPVLLHIYTALVSLFFGTVIPTSFLLEMFILLFAVYTDYSLGNTMLYAFVQAPPHFAVRGHVKCTWI